MALCFEQLSVQSFVLLRLVPSDTVVEEGIVLG